MRRGEGSGRSSGAPFFGQILPREGLLLPPRRRIEARRRRIERDGLVPTRVNPGQRSAQARTPAVVDGVGKRAQGVAACGFRRRLPCLE
jgi:hypothetical protein